MPWDVIRPPPAPQTDNQMFLENTLGQWWGMALLVFIASIVIVSVLNPPFVQGTAHSPLATNYKTVVGLSLASAIFATLGGKYVEETRKSDISHPFVDMDSSINEPPLSTNSQSI